MIGYGWNILYLEAGLHESLQPCSRAARKWRENEEMKRKRRGNGERMRKWRENFLILPLYPPSLSISYIKICHILSQNVKYGIFVANVTKTEHTRYEEIILGRILCQEAPQVVSAWLQNIPCNSALLAQKTLFLTQKGTVFQIYKSFGIWEDPSPMLGKIPK